MALTLYKSPGTSSPWTLLSVWSNYLRRDIAVTDTVQRRDKIRGGSYLKDILKSGIINFRKCVRLHEIQQNIILSAK